MSRVLTVSTSRIRRARSSRLLSYLLLFLICYGSTVEIFHHHGLATQNLSAAQTSSDLSANLLSDGEQSKSSTKTPLERDCLVCQFQRGLSNTAIAAPLLVLAQVDVRITARKPRLTFFYRVSRTRSTTYPLIKLATVVRCVAA
jgi:hypothetical protein